LNLASGKFHFSGGCSKFMIYWGTDSSRETSPVPAQMTPTHRRTDRLPPPPPTHTPPPGIYSEGESEDFPLSLLDSRSNKRVTKVKVKKWVSPSKLEKREKERKEREERESMSLSHHINSGANKKL
jgi:hypothetical protein